MMGRQIILRFEAFLSVFGPFLAIFDRFLTFFASPLHKNH